MPLIEQRILIIEDEHLQDIRLVASELERHRMTVEALHSHLIHLVGMATRVDLEIDDCELDAMRGVVKCAPSTADQTPINVMGEELMDKACDQIEAIRSLGLRAQDPGGQRG